MTIKILEIRIILAKEEQSSVSARTIIIIIIIKWLKQRLRNSSCVRMTAALATVTKKMLSIGQTNISRVHGILYLHML